MSGILSVLVAAGSNAPFFPGITDRSLSNTTASPFNAQVGVEFNTNGSLTTYDGGGTVRSPEWAGTQGLTYSDAVRQRFQIRLTVQSGAPPTAFSDDIDAWLPFTEQRAWFLNQSAVGTSTATWLVEIRCDGSMPALASATYTLSVTKL